MKNTIDASNHLLDDVTIFESTNALKIGLSKRERRRAIFFIVFMPILFIVIIIFLFSKAKRLDSVEVGVLAAIFFLLFTFCYFNSWRKTIKNLKGVSFEKKKSSVFMCNIFLCEKKNIKNVVIQPKIGVCGFGLSCTVGITVNKKQIPLSFSHRHSEAMKIASILSVFFDCSIVENKVMQISAHTKW